MKTNWKQTVSEINRKRYVIPAGWETRDQVAESLQCDPAKVGDLLKPGIQSGDIERQAFQVWDEGRRMAISVPCYRIAGKAAPEAGELSPADERIAASIRRNPSYPNAKIGSNLKVPAAEVARVREMIG